MYNDDNRFNLYLAEITDAFKKNPSKTKEIIERYIECINYKNNNKKIVLDISKYSHILLLIFVCFAILVLGLFNIDQYVLYVGGFIFFVVGMLIGTFVPGFGIIFLFSHGLTGLYFMINSLSIKEYAVILTDLPIFYTIVIYIIVIALFVLAVGFVIAYSLGKLKNKKYAVSYSFICIFILLVVVLLIPYIVKFLNLVL